MSVETPNLESVYSNLINDNRFVRQVKGAILVIATRQIVSNPPTDPDQLAFHQKTLLLAKRITTTPQVLNDYGELLAMAISSATGFPSSADGLTDEFVYESVQQHIQKFMTFVFAQG